MIVIRIFKVFVFLILWLAFASCASNSPNTSELIQVTGSDELQNDQDIYIAWSQGIVGSGNSDDDYGIGGTGISNNDYGIGGTGIIGTISGFGSIIVNGLHIEYSPDQKLESPLGDKTAASLSVGHIVAVKAMTSNGQLVATKIIQQIALAGVVEEIDVPNRRIKVSGENVSIITNNDSNSLAIDNITIGSHVIISGMRDSDTLYATNIAKQSGQLLSFVSGNITAIKTGRIEIDNRLTIKLEREALSEVKVGDFVNVDKIYSKSKNKTKKLSLRRLYGPMFDGSVDRASVEGFFSLRNTAKSTQKLMRKTQLNRQVIFQVKGSNNKSIVIGTVELDKERRKKLDFKRQSKVIKNNPKINKLKEKNSRPTKISPTKNQSNARNSQSSSKPNRNANSKKR